MSPPPAGARAELLVYLRLIAGHAQPQHWLDVRWRSPAGVMWRRSIPAADTPAAAAWIRRLCTAGDVYVGAALRDRADRGGNDAIAASRVLYLDCDEPHPLRVAAFPHPASLVIASGTPGRLQLYWLLTHTATGDAVEEANRRLAVVLHGDPACTDLARVLRPPGTLNHKHNPPRPVHLIVHRPDARYKLHELTSGLPPDPRREDSGRDTPNTTQGQRPLVCSRSSKLIDAGCVSAVRVRSPLERALLAIPAADYVRVLVSATPNREGKILCPFHEESNPSLQLYPDGTFYCFGSTCRVGGTIIDFAAHLWHISPRDAGFAEILTRLATRLNVPLNL